MIFLSPQKVRKKFGSYRSGPSLIITEPPYLLASNAFQRLSVSIGQSGLYYNI
jgi:hypothetical protein